jgi:hypothetical protein
LAVYGWPLPDHPGVLLVGRGPGPAACGTVTALGHGALDWRAAARWAAAELAEDYPVMPCEYAGFIMKSFGFFAAIPLSTWRPRLLLRAVTATGEAARRH